MRGWGAGQGGGGRGQREGGRKRGRRGGVEWDDRHHHQHHRVTCQAYVYVKHFFSFGVLFDGGRGRFFALSCRGKQGVRRYITTHVLTPTELRGACFEHPKTLSWLFRQGVAFRLAEPSSAMEKTPTICSVLQHSPLRYNFC